MTIKCAFYCHWDQSYNHELANKCTWNRDYKYKNIEIVSDKDSYDYIICNTREPDNVDTKKCILLQAEPFYYREFFFQRGKPDKNKYFFVYDKHCLDYHWLKINASLKDLYESTRYEKTHTLATFCSNKSNDNMPGYKERLSFLYYLDSYYKHDNLDIYTLSYSNDNIEGDFKRNNHLLNSLKRSKITPDFKDDVLRRTKYIIESENCHEYNYFTEKILGPLFYDCIVFYNGCPNISDFIDRKFFVGINLTSGNYKESLEIIHNTIENHEYEKRKEHLLELRRKYLIQYNPLEILNQIFEEKTA